jgi:hypothetical protein
MLTCLGVLDPYSWILKQIQTFSSFGQLFSFLILSVAVMGDFYKTINSSRTPKLFNAEPKRLVVIFRPDNLGDQI